MQTFSCNPPINLSEECKWFLGVISFEVTNSFFDITDQKKSFPITTLGYWTSRGGEARINKQRELLALRELKDIELKVGEVRKRGNQIKAEEKEHKLSDLGTHKNEIIKELKSIEYNDLEDMVLRMELTYSETENIVDMNNIDASTTRYTLEPRIY